MHTYIPSLLNLPPNPHTTEYQAKLPVLYSSFPLALYFKHGSVNISTLLSQFVPPSPSPTVSTSPFSVSPSLLLPCKYVHLDHFSRFHTYALTYDMLWYFSLSDLLHSSWQTIGPSTSLQIHITQFCSLLCLSNIFCCIHVPHLYPLTCEWTFVLLPLYSGGDKLIQDIRSDRQSAWKTMDGGLWHCTGGRD